MERTSTHLSRLALLAAIPALLCVGACDDEYREVEPTITHRAGFNVVYQVKASKAKNANGCPDPFGDVCPDPPLPFNMEQILQRIEIYDAEYGEEFAGSEEAEEICNYTCESVRRQWNGVTDVRGEYDFGEPYAIELDNGERSAEVEVFAELEYGCGCTRNRGRGG